MDDARYNSPHRRVGTHDPLAGGGEGGAFVANLIFDWHCRPSNALDLQTFTQCIGPNGQGPVCQLDAGSYSINATLFIGRSNITIQGGAPASPSSTTLQRAAGFTSSLLRDTTAPLSPLHSITIRYLTFDGYRTQNTGPYSSYSPEVGIFTTTSLLVSNCAFIESPNSGLALYGAGASGIVVNNSTFSHNLIYGLWAGATGNHGGASYLDCAGLTFAVGIVIANNQFDRTGENAILGDFVGLQLIGNTFTNTYSYAVVSGVNWGGAGGQIDLTPCTQDAAVVGNTFEGELATADPGLNPGTTQGIEVHASDVSIINNTATKNPGEGLSLGGAASIFIANWDPKTGFLVNGGGIGISQGSDHDSIRPVDFITIDNAQIVGNQDWGIWFNTVSQPINHVMVTNSCINANIQGPLSPLSALGTDAVIQSNPLAGCGPK